MSEIPEWALDEALRRCGVAPDQKPLSDWRDATYATAVRLFALHIAAHEEPPVDPLLVEAREIVADWNRPSAPGFADETLAGEHDKAGTVVCALAALKRGIELGKGTE